MSCFTKPRLFFGNSLGRYENDSLLHVFQSLQNAALFTGYQKKKLQKIDYNHLVHKSGITFMVHTY